ncbi:hypothetical protein EVAR_24860_1 [Eumeta japonica]|uniref:Uncharacterized protein n=1 Tax=Eumeta variegata TaxID=151549 RepID=A0A4C1YBQ7_EUMVA|nr:hypothetical protein EVAR_24860_1 [Eumeta japonica]
MSGPSMLLITVSNKITTLDANTQTQRKSSSATKCKIVRPFMINYILEGGGGLSKSPNWFIVSCFVRQSARKSLLLMGEIFKKVSLGPLRSGGGRCRRTEKLELGTAHSEFLEVARYLSHKK